MQCVSPFNWSLNVRTGILPAAPYRGLSPLVIGPAVINNNKRAREGEIETTR
jgi:hypothetical protein